MSSDFVNKLLIKGISEEDMTNFPANASYIDLCKLAIDYSDGVIQRGANVSQELIDYARQSGKPFLEFKEGDDFKEACNDFYDEVWTAGAATDAQ
jgi:starch synthase